MRHNTDRAVVIHVEQCLKSGVEFKISEQGTWLTWGLEMRNGYFGILPSDIHKVHCLPSWEKDVWKPVPYTELCYAAQGERYQSYSSGEAVAAPMVRTNMPQPEEMIGEAKAEPETEVVLPRTRYLAQTKAPPPRGCMIGAKEAAASMNQGYASPSDDESDTEERKLQETREAGLVTHTLHT